ncbi:MAG TPA: hypothetical protein VGI10_05670 [Polyangiaceae bacterium]
MPYSIASILLAMLSLGCGARVEPVLDTCALRFKCPADPEPDPGTTAACEQRASQRCGELLSAVNACIYEHEQCTPSGLMDEVATGAFCGFQATAYFHCFYGK